MSDRLSRDRHNDYSQIYVRQDNGAFLLTDGGETIQDLRASGCDLETSKRKVASLFPEDVTAGARILERKGQRSPRIGCVAAASGTGSDLRGW